MYSYLDDAIYEGLILEQPRSVEENIRRGTNAFHRVMNSHSAELMAMFRKELGWIGFEWGEPGTEPPVFDSHEEFREWQKTGRKPFDKGGHGVAHIIAKRDWEGQHIQQFKGQKGIDLIGKIIGAIAKGEVKIKGLKAVIKWDGMEIALAKKGTNSAPYWLLTGYVKPTQGYTYILESAGEWGGVDDLALAPTHIRPTLYRPYMGAANPNGIFESVGGTGGSIHPVPPMHAGIFDAHHGVGATGSNKILDFNQDDVNAGWLYDL